MSLRVVLFGTGSPLSLAALAAASRAAAVVAVVTPSGPPLRGVRSAVRRLARRRATAPFRRLARGPGAEVLRFDAARLEAELVRLAPDLLCVASFPRLLRPALLETARFGAVGLHTSLLPRHRGPDPLFWTYFQDDREAGVTLYWLDAGEDTGDLIDQESVPLARGRPVAELYAELARRGATLLERALPEIPAGRVARRPQSSSQATREPRPDPRTCRIDWESWSAERVFHVLGGLGEVYPLLADASGRPLRVGPVRRLLPQPHDRQPGTIELDAGGLRVYCLHGVVEVSAARSTPRMLRPLLAMPGWSRPRSG